MKTLLMSITPITVQQNEKKITEKIENRNKTSQTNKQTNKQQVNAFVWQQFNYIWIIQGSLRATVFSLSLSLNRKPLAKCANP